MKTRKLLLALLLLTAAASAYAGDFTITNSGNEFTVTRSDASTVETVNYHTTSISALANQHFEPQSGTFTFAINETVKRITITENDFSGLVEPYRYQEVDRSYRFEVSDQLGKRLAYCDRTLSAGSSYMITASAFEKKSVSINDGPIKVTDGGYAQGGQLLPFSRYYSVAIPEDYMIYIGAYIYMTVDFSAYESDDGYQYIQILIDDRTNCDTGAGSGDPGTLDKSYYMAGFGHDPGDKRTTPAKYSFPLTSAEDGCGEIDKAWNYSPLNNTYGKLYTQKFKMNFRAPDGRLRVPHGAEYIVLRFNASGDLGDTWYAQGVTAVMEAVDSHDPAIIASDIKVSGGPFYYGSTVTISVPFREIVTVTGSPTLRTNWGSFAYVSGSGTDVLCFSGTLTATGVTALTVNSISGTVMDHSGNSFGGDISHSLSGYTSLGHDLSEFTKIGDNTYAIASISDLKLLSEYCNTNHNCEGMTFLQTEDIIVSSTNMRPIGYRADYDSDTDFRGTYDGQNHVVSGLNISVAKSWVGLFGFVYGGSVKNVILKNSTISGKDKVGAIVGELQYGSIINCRVESSVTINNGTNGGGPVAHGGIVGNSYRTESVVEGCFCAAKLTNFDTGGSGGDFGGISGQNYCKIRNCLFMGPKFTANAQYGAIVGYADNDGTLTNNYYTTANFWGLGRVEGTSNNVDVDGACRACIIRAGEGVTVSPTDDATSYAASGITAYGTTSIMYNGTLYSGKGHTVNLRLSHEERPGYTFGGYTASGGTLSGEGDSYSLKMPGSDVTISAVWTAADDLSVTVREAVMDGQTKFWATFYHPTLSYRLPSVALALTMKGDKVLYAVGDGDIIPAGCPVVIMADASAVTNISDGTGTLTLSRTGETATPEDGNILVGTGSATAASGLASGGKKVYVLGKKDGNFGFYEFSGTFVPANKAYYVE